MPELPEVETVRVQLAKYLVGQTIARIEILKERSMHGDEKLVLGKKVVAVRRLGKMLVVDLSVKLCLAIHFKMSGQLIYVNPKNHVKVAGGHPTEDWVAKLPGGHTRVVFYFKGGDMMYFNDQRMFGWVKIMKAEELVKMEFVKKLGPEPWDISLKQFYTRIQRKNKAIKVVLMEQDIVSGVGNIYANDGLWEARIDPRRKASSLNEREATIALDGVIKVLKEGIKYGGATAADVKYLNLDGMGGKYQEHFRTYDRAGETCRRNDGGEIQKITLGGRGTYFCPVCQK